MKTYLQRVSAGTFLLFLALFSGFFSLRDCFALSVDPFVLFLACLVSALLAAAILALPGSLSSWIALLAVALCAASLSLDFDQLLQGMQVVFHQISLGFHEEIPTILYYELPSALENASQIHLTHLATRFVAQCLPLAALWMGIWLVQSRFVWPALIASLLLPSLGLFILREPGVIPLAALLLFLTLVILTRRSFAQSPAVGSRRVWLCLPPLAIIMVALALLFPKENYQRWDWLETQRLRAISWTSHVSGPGASTGGPAVPGIQSFRQSGPLRFDGHTVLNVTTTQDTAILYLKGFTAGTYTRTGWQPIEAEMPSLVTPESPWIFPAQAQLPETGYLISNASVTVTEVDAKSNYVYLPYYPLSIPQYASITADAYVELPEGTDTWTVSYLPELDDSALLTDTASQLEEQYREYVYDNYLDVPESLLTQGALDIIQNYANGVEIDSGNLSQMAYRKALAADVRRFLASFTTYDQGATATPSGEDLVSRFLTQTRRGYCLHYATAATLILRKMGIPTRYAAGYVAQDLKANTLTKVPDRNAHAWVEIYVDGVGWLAEDVTPGFSGNQTTSPTESPTPTPSTETTPSATPTPSPSSASPTPSPSPNGHSKIPKGSAFPWKQIAGWTFGISTFLAIFILQRRYRLKKRKKACSQENTNQAVLALYRYLRATEEQIGYEIPQKAIDLAQKAAFSQHILTDAERHAMEGYVQAAAQKAQEQNVLKRFVLRYVFALI